MASSENELVDALRIYIPSKSEAAKQVQALEIDHDNWVRFVGNARVSCQKMINTKILPCHQRLRAFDLSC